MRAYSTKVPSGSLIQSYLPCDFADAFAVGLPRPTTLSADDIQIRFWTRSPAWVESMMRLRNLLVRPFGLKGSTNTADEFGNAVRSGGSCGFMTVVAKSDNETLIKLNDKHLTAYISIIVEPQEVTATTVVHFKNTLGRVYFAVIKPFHKVIVKSTLKRAVRDNCD